MCSSAYSVYVYLALKFKPSLFLNQIYTRLMLIADGRLYQLTISFSDTGVVRG